MAAIDRREVAVGDLIETHIAFAEALAATDEHGGAERLWAGEAGQALAAFVVEAEAAAPALGVIDGGHWPALLDALLAGRVVRPSYGRHPRLHIWGPLEARLLHADLVVLGGLNEGSWPPDPGADPWMSRPMRAQFGLPPAERRIGLAAHDFAQAFCAGEVMLTRAKRLGGTPTVPSRWLLRIDNVLERAGLADALSRQQAKWLTWQARLDESMDDIAIKAPAPTPPVAARPRRLSVTQIETLMRDPYAVYARHVLGLRALDPIDADPGAAERGSIVHRALDAFLREFPDDLPDDAVARLLEIGARAFGTTLERPGVRAFWWPRFERIAAWFVDRESGERTRLARVHSEVRGEIEIDAPAGPFVVTAIADRVNEFRDGGLSIVDYKTGAPPKPKEVEAGIAPQLPLEAAIAAAGGFAGIAAGAVTELSFWRLSGGEPAGEVISAGADIDALAAAARHGLARLIAEFDDPETPYRSQPHPERAPRFSDYHHLARIQEWIAQSGEGSS